MEEKELIQFNYALSAKEPAKRIAKLKKALETNRVYITPFEIGTVQSDRLYASVDVTYKQLDGLTFEITNVEEVK
jgi:hypothetical protein